MSRITILRVKLLISEGHEEAVMNCRNPRCKVGEIIKDQYGAEGDAPFAARLASGFCSKRCRRLAGPLPKDRPKSTLEAVSLNYERPELTAVEKVVPERDPARLAFARSMPCCCCGSIEGIHAHHEQEEGHGTMGGKTSDRRSAPMCWKCHKLRHDKGRSFWGTLDIESIILQINEAYDIFRLSK